MLKRLLTTRRCRSANTIQLLILIGLITSAQTSHAQSAGQWGICEFATTTTLNAYDPSSGNWDCKLAFCQANDLHYYWDGSAWVEMALYNVYTDNGTLTGERTITLNGNDFIIDVDNDASTQFIIDDDRLTIGRDAQDLGDIFISSKMDMSFSVDNANDGGDRFRWGAGAAPDLGRSDGNYDEWMSLNASGLTLTEYGSGTKTGTSTFILAVDADGDIIETNISKSAQVFYPPAVVIDASTIAADLTLDLHQEYVDRFGTPAVVSSSAPTAIPYYAQDELYYYVTDYDTDVFENLSIDADGILTYDIKASPADDFSLINVVFVVK